MTKLAYWVDLGKTALFDAGSPEGATGCWIQAFPFGEWDHPLHGKIKMDVDKATRMAQNIKGNVRGQELDIDYDHKATDGKAAGWVKDAEVRSDGLYWFIEWTKAAAEALKNKEYRYFSPEYDDEWTHPQGQKFKDVAFGGAITNRPFLKGILPINLSELTGDSDPPSKEEPQHMDPKELRKLLGLPEDATDEQVNAKLKEKLETPQPDPNAPPVPDPNAPPPPTPPTPPENEPAPTPENLVPALSEAQVKKLTELGLGGVVETLVAQNKALNERAKEDAKRLSTLETANRLGEISRQLSELVTPTNKRQSYALAPVVTKELSDICVQVPKQLSDKIISTVQTILEKGLVELGERAGYEPDPSDEGKTASETFSNRVTKLMESNKTLSYADAVEQVSAEDPDLFDAYRDESFANEGVE